jgi:hypothetical protein
MRAVLPKDGVGQPVGGQQGGSVHLKGPSGDKVFDSG